MKIIILAGVLSLLPMAALAQSGADTQTVNIGAVSPKYDLSQGHRVMSADEFGQFTGSYDLSNGKTLSLFTRGEKKYAAIQGEARHELIATRGNSFVSVDRQLKMTIVRDENGDAKGELLIAGPAPLARAGTHKKHAALLASR